MSFVIYKKNSRGRISNCLYQFILAELLVLISRHTLDRTAVRVRTRQTHNLADTHTQGQIREIIQPKSSFWTMGGSWSTPRDPRHAKGIDANSMQKDLWPGLEPNTFLLQGSSGTAVCMLCDGCKN